MLLLSAADGFFGESVSGAAESSGRICGGGSSAGFCDGGRLLLGGLVEAGSVELLLRYCRWTVLREGKTDRWQRLREGCVAGENEKKKMAG